jgi:hypothetical protein
MIRGYYYSSKGRLCLQRERHTGFGGRPGVFQYYGTKETSSEIMKK